MKKVLITICLGAMFLTSCGGGSDVKADAKKMADLTCEMTKAMKADPSKGAELAAKAGTESLEMMKKYDTAEKQAEFAKALAEFTADCK